MCSLSQNSVLRNFRKSTFLFLLVAMTSVSFIYPEKNESSLTLIMDHYVANQPLMLDTVSYSNALGQRYTITKFKYYISNLRLIAVSGSDVNIEKYFLVNEEDSTSKRLNLDEITAGSYKAIEFIIGVDSLHNCSGAQSGALDPANAMFWTWNNGYIFMKLEGKSTASNAHGHVIEYHIGGYKAPANCIRKVRLDFKEPLKILGDQLLHLKVDLSEILKTPAAIDFSKLPTVTDAKNATLIADNYIDMFSTNQ